MALLEGYRAIKKEISPVGEMYMKLGKQIYLEREAILSLFTEAVYEASRKYLYKSLINLRDLNSTLKIEADKYKYEFIISSTAKKRNMNTQSVRDVYDPLF